MLRRSRLNRRRYRADLHAGRKGTGRASEQAGSRRIELILGDIQTSKFQILNFLHQLHVTGSCFVSGTAERIFMKLLPNNSGDNGVCIAVPKWG